jgi:hypothetical protein
MNLLRNNRSRRPVSNGQIGAFLAIFGVLPFIYFCLWLGYKLFYGG